MRGRPFANTVDPPAATSDYISEAVLDSLPVDGVIVDPNANLGTVTSYPLPLWASDVPFLGIDDEPQVSLCFAESAAPYVMGALKQLADPRVWKGELDEIKHVSQEFGLIQDRLQEGCGAVVSDWSYQYSYDENSLPLFAYRPETDGGLLAVANTRSLVIGVRNPDPDNLSTDVTITLVDSLSDPLGAHIDEIFVSTWGQIGVMAIGMTDCLDNFLSDAFSDHYRLTDTFAAGKDLKTIEISGTAEFWAVEVVGHGLIVCGSA